MKCKHSLLEIFEVPPVHGTGKAADFKFGSDIHEVYPKKSLLKILQERERWRTQRLPKFLDTPIISETAKDTYFKLCTHINRVDHRVDRNKSPCKILEKVAVGVVKVPKISRASRGHLCDSTALLYRSYTRLSKTAFYVARENASSAVDASACGQISPDSKGFGHVPHCSGATSRYTRYTRLHTRTSSDDIGRGARHFFARKYMYKKITKMPKFYTLFARFAPVPYANVGLSLPFQCLASGHSTFENVPPPLSICCRSSRPVPF